MADTPRWTGIQQFNDNTRVTNYHNMIPMGDLCVDRLGCDEMLLPSTDTTTQLFYDIPTVGEFVDSHNNLYWCKQVSSGNFVLTRYNATTGKYTQRFFELDSVQKCSFVESSVSPQVIYLLIQTHANDKIVYWKTEDPDMNVTNLSPIMGSTRVVTIQRDGNGNWTSYSYGYEQVMAKVPRIKFLSWYDNRLIATDYANNIVWLSSTNFQARLDTQSEFDALQTNAERQAFYMNETKRYTLRFYGIEIDKTTEQLDLTWTDYAFPNWYSSTNNSDIIQNAIGFAGQLYLFYSRTIERWSRTGIEDAPIQFNTNGTVSVGGKSPLAINDELYFIGNDQLGNQFAGKFTNDNNFVRISNPEIEKRFGNSITDIGLLLQRQDTFCLFRKTYFNTTESALAVSRNGFWWEFNNDVIDEHVPVRSIYKNFAISNKGVLCKFTEEHRKNIDGTPIARFIREALPFQPSGRKVASVLAVTCDTGMLQDSDPIAPDDPKRNSLWARLSVNHGLTFGRIVFRLLGKPGQNDKTMVFRNLGSGTNFVYEVGTSANTKFQIYDITLKLH